MAKRRVVDRTFIGCTPVRLPDELLVESAARAIAENPVNAPPRGMLDTLLDFAPEPEHLAVMVSKYWKAGGVKLTVGFMEPTPADVQSRILAHANAWSEFGNISFVLSQIDPQVRITREASGYWSYLGLDILSIPKNQPTMCFQGFSASTPESEYKRVVRHEFGHTLGFPHEHLRAEIIQRLDKAKTIAYFQRTQGWSAQVTTQQVLTPLNEASLIATDHADTTSIMTYALPGSITVDGQPIIGGTDIDPQDQAFVAKVYPRPDAPPPPPPPPSGADQISINTTTKKITAPGYALA
jgi:hypothetical protein